MYKEIFFKIHAYPFFTKTFFLIAACFFSTKNIYFFNPRLLVFYNLFLVHDWPPSTKSIYIFFNFILFPKIIFKKFTPLLFRPKIFFFKSSPVLFFTKIFFLNPYLSFCYKKFYFFKSKPVLFLQKIFSYNPRQSFSYFFNTRLRFFFKKYY